MTPNVGVLAALGGWWLILAAEGPPLTPEAILTQAGLAGIILISLWRRWLYVGSWVQEKDARIERLEAENAALRKTLDDYVAKVAEGQTALISDLTSTLKRVAASAEGRSV